LHDLTRPGVIQGLRGIDLKFTFLKESHRNLVCR